MQDHKGFVSKFADASQWLIKAKEKFAECSDAAGSRAELEDRLDKVQVRHRDIHQPVFMDKVQVRHRDIHQPVFMDKVQVRLRDIHQPVFMDKVQVRHRDIHQPVFMDKVQVRH